MTITLITGTPGTGKTSLAKVLGKMLKAEVLNDAEFCLKQKIGSKNSFGELEVEPEKLQKTLKSFLSGKKKNLILEGHLFCEVKFSADFAILLHCSAKNLEKRLLKKGYSMEKACDNIFCEETGYCKKMVLKNFPKAKLLELECDKNPKLLAKLAFSEIMAKARFFAEYKQLIKFNLLI